MAIVTFDLAEDQVVDSQKVQIESFLKHVG